jgi:hypothetical protein
MSRRSTLSLSLSLSLTHTHIINRNGASIYTHTQTHKHTSNTRTHTDDKQGWRLNLHRALRLPGQVAQLHRRSLPRPPPNQPQVNLSTFNLHSTCIQPAFNHSQPIYIQPPNTPIHPTPWPLSPPPPSKSTTGPISFIFSIFYIYLYVNSPQMVLDNGVETHPLPCHGPCHVPSGVSWLLFGVPGLDAALLPRQ